MHVVAVLAFDGVVPFDLATPCEVFGRASLADGHPGYEVRVCGVTPEVNAGPFALRTRYGLRTLTKPDTVIFPGTTDLNAKIPEPLLKAVINAAASGARVA